MSDPFIGEIKLVAFNYPPKGWALCNGQLLPDQPEPGAVLAARDDVRRRRARQLRPARPAGPGARSTSGSGHTLGRARRRAGAHAERSPRCRRTCTPSTRHERRRDDRAPSAARDARRRAPNVAGLRAGREPRRHGRGRVHQRRRQPGRTRTCSPTCMLSFCIALQGIFPSPQLGVDHGTALHRRDPHVRRQLRAGRLDVLRRPAAADLRERGPLQPDRHDLRRRRPEDVRRCPTCAGGSRSTRATASSSAETGGAEAVTLTTAQMPGAHPPVLGSTATASVNRAAGQRPGHDAPV